MPRSKQSSMPSHIRDCCLLAASAVILCVCAGCYDGEALVNRAQSTAHTTRLVEVDLGQYMTTLPRHGASNRYTELDLHIFGAVPRYRVPAVEKQLKAENFRLRHETLAALRGTSADDLAEPSLDRLRDRIEHVVNTILADAPVQSIGFYQVTLRQR